MSPPGLAGCGQRRHVFALSIAIRRIAISNNILSQSGAQVKPLGIAVVLRLRDRFVSLERQSERRSIAGGGNGYHAALATKYRRARQALERSAVIELRGTSWAKK